MLLGQKHTDVCVQHVILNKCQYFIQHASFCVYLFDVKLIRYQSGLDTRHEECVHILTSIQTHNCVFVILFSFLYFSVFSLNNVFALVLY